MSAEIANVSGHVLTMKVSGTLTQAELAGMQSAAAGLISAGGKWRILVLTENFEGWERGGTWNDFSFTDHDASVERMAIVGERRWEELTLLFTAQGLRAFPIEYFEPGQIAEARQWLAAREMTN
ncbi:MAG TPA: STAS/SEC14 domain-containing protein [Steroidobacteraceae bacterium]|nr:STAS/SEC14 domain-containing protein [Steroidobacteraceae bacterium]